MKIVFPELENPVIREAVEVTDVEAVGVDDLAEACKLVREGKAEALVAGIDYTSREVILACREGLGMTGKTFSASFVLRRDGDEAGEEVYVLGDAAACKNPTEEQLFEIVCQTWETARVMVAEPRVAMLSFSTLGSGGQDPSIARAKAVLARVQAERPEIVIDGELQLDAAVNPQVGAKKAPGSLVAGRANVLIAPDLNAGNILYKAMEQFGGFTAAGPILQGFGAPASDLSRGSTVEDVVAVIRVLERLAAQSGATEMTSGGAQGAAGREN